MDLKNIEKLPVSAREPVKQLLHDIFGVFGGEMVSVFAYGSVTGPDYDPKKSDINIAVVLNDVSIGKFKPILKNIRSGMKKGITVPLFMTPRYIKMSLDTFPMELMNMKDSRCVLHGDDILAEINVQREDLRRECEYQLKGKVLTIRQAYLEHALNKKDLVKLVRVSIRALLPVFRNIIRIKTDVMPPVRKDEVLRRLGEEFNVDVTELIRIVNGRKLMKMDGDADKFIESFISKLEHLSALVDSM